MSVKQLLFNLFIFFSLILRMTPLATSQAHQLSMSSLELDFPGESAYMIPAKNLGGGGEGSLEKKNFGGGSTFFMKFYSRFVKILRVGQTNP
jgi:hypothetical protein